MAKLKLVVKVLLLIIGVVIAGVVITFPRSVANSRARAYLRTMEEDLGYLLAFQEEYRQEHGVYADTIGALEFYASEDVEIRIFDVTSRGFSATAYNPAWLPGSGCVVFRGPGPAPATERGTRASEEGVVACDNPRGARVVRD